MLYAFLVVFIIAGIYLVIKRSFKNKAQAAKSQSLMKAIATDPASIGKLKSELFTLYSNHPYPENFDLSRFFSFIEAGTTIDRFKIDSLHKLDDEWMVITTCTDKDYDVSIGHFGDATKVYNLNFRIKINAQKKLIEVFSNYQNNNTLKGLCARFGSKLFEFINEKHE
ncbi:MAG: hypothetical protein ACHQF2_07935 [Flavobacteriales bacterium]